MAERLLHASDVASAAEWVFSEPVHHDGTRTLGRKYLAKTAYWHALAEIGYSAEEIARMTGAHRTTILHGLRHEVDPELVAGVLERAREQIGAEVAS